MPLDRGWLNSLVDDLGDGLTGTIWNKEPEIRTFHDVIDAALLPLEVGRPHAPSHAQGGSDPVNILLLAGYPGGATLFLRGDGTFAAPGPVGLLPHAATHAPGGSDPLTGSYAALAASNTFSQPQVIQVGTTNPYLEVHATSAPVDKRRWAFSGQGSVEGELGIVAVSDAGAAQAYVVFKRDGTILCNGLGATPLNANSLLSGTIPDARLSANVQLKPIGAGDLPAHASRHASGGADPLSVLALSGYPGGTATFLRADGTFAAPPGGGGGTPGGATTQVQFNDAGTFGGHAGMTYDKAGTLSLGTQLRLPNAGSILWRNGANTADLRGLYVDGNNALILGEGLAYSLVHTPIWPYPDNTRDLGDGSFRFRDGYIGRDLRVYQDLFVTRNSYLSNDLLFIGDRAIRRNTVDGADTGHLYLCGGGAYGTTRGASLELTGNEATPAGAAVLQIGNVAGSGFAIWSPTTPIFTVDANGVTVINSVLRESLTINSTAANGGYLTIKRAGIAVGFVGYGQASFGLTTQTNDDLVVYAGIAGSKLFLEAPGGTIKSATIWADTVGSGSAMFIESDGRIRHASSTRRFKTAIAPLTEWRWFLDLEAVEFADTHTPEGRKSGGFIAEDVAERGPIRNGVPMFAGLDAEGLPVDVAYMNLVAVIQLGLKDLDRRLAALERTP